MVDNKNYTSTERMEYYATILKAEVKERSRQENQMLKDKLIKERVETQRMPPEQHREYTTKKFVQEKHMSGEIVSPFIQKWLDDEISSARTILFVGMALTCLIQGQIFIWAIMYIAYRGRVKRARQEALEEDIRRHVYNERLD